MKEFPSFKQFVESQLSGYYMGRGADSREVKELERAVSSALNPRHADELNSLHLVDLRKDITDLYNRVEGELKGELVKMHRAVNGKIKEMA